MSHSRSDGDADREVIRFAAEALRQPGGEEYGRGEWGLVVGRLSDLKWCQRGAERPADHRHGGRRQQERYEISLQVVAGSKEGSNDECRRRRRQLDADREHANGKRHRGNPGPAVRSAEGARRPRMAPAMPRNVTVAKMVARQCAPAGCRRAPSPQ